MTVHVEVAPRVLPASKGSVYKPGRVLSVDLLRGLTMALMILVNDPGDWSHVFSQLDHAEWNGWTLTDLVFPTFLFLVGASIVFSMMAREEKGDCKKTQAGHIFLRFVKLIALAWVLGFFPRMHWTMRIFGVLERIAVCYLIAALVLLATRRMRMLAVIVAGILVGYWVLLRWVPVPGAGMPVRDVPLMDQFNNLAAWVDRGVSAWMLKWLHTGTLYEKTRDPEGLLSTLPAVATALMGSMTGLWMRRADLSAGRMRGVLTAAGTVSVTAGLVWGRWFPINKNLWTSSYVLLAAGITAIVLAGASWLVDGRERPWPTWLQVVTWPWFVFGSNAIAAFTVSIVIVKTCLYVHVMNGDARTTIWGAIYADLFARHGSTVWTSLAFAVSFVVVCFLPNWWLWRKRIFLRV